MIVNPAIFKVGGASRNVTLVIDGTGGNGGARIATGTDGTNEYFTWNKGEIITKVVPAGSILWAQYARNWDWTMTGVFRLLASSNNPSMDVYSILGGLRLFSQVDY